MNRPHLTSIICLAGFFAIFAGLFIWSRWSEARNYLDPMDAESIIAAQEDPTPDTITLPPIRSSDPSRGSTSTDALVIVEFADYNCLYCRLTEPELRQAMQAFPTQTRLVWRDLPLNANQPDGLLPAVAGRCAQEQGKFWEMHDAMFASSKLDRTGVETAATGIKLNMAAFNACLDSNRHETAIRAEVALARSSGIEGSPTFFIGKQVASGYIKAQALADLIAQSLSATANVKR